MPFKYSPWKCEQTITQKCSRKIYSQSIKQKHHCFYTAPQPFSDCLGNVEPLHLKTWPLPLDHTTFNWNQSNNHLTRRWSFSISEIITKCIHTYLPYIKAVINTFTQDLKPIQPYSWYGSVRWTEHAPYRLLRHYKRQPETRLGSFVTAQHQEILW